MADKAAVMQQEKEVQLVVFRLRDEEFGAEIGSVLVITRVLEITHLPEAPSFITGMVNLRGQVIPVVDLARQFSLPSQPALPKTARIIVAEVGGETVGLLVDEVPEVLRISETDLEPPPELIQSEAGQAHVKWVAKLGERLVIVLDLNKTLTLHQVEAAGKLAEGR